MFNCVKMKQKQYRCSCGAQGNYDYIVEHARAAKHELDPCEMGEHEYEVLRSFASSSGSVEVLRCRRCGFKKKVVK